MGVPRCVPAAVLLAASWLCVPPATAAGTLRITSLKVVTEKPAAGKAVEFSARAVFPGEEWIGFEWNFGEGTEAAGITFASEATSTRSHTFAEAGSHKVICTAFHGYKSGEFGVGPYKYRMSRSVTVELAPTLPLTVGVLTIDGDTIESTNEKNTAFLIAGNVRINGGLVLGNPVAVDIEKKTVQLSGALAIPGAGEYAGGIEFLKDLTLDAVTGGFASVDLPSVTAEFEVAGFGAKLENVRIVGAGLEIDFEVKIPRLTEDPDDPDEAPQPDDPIDLSDVFPDGSDPDELAGLSFKKFRIDAVSPYLHALGETKATISNVPLGFAGTKFAIEKLEAGFDASQKRYFGTLTLKLPTDRGIGGTFEIREGQWEKVGFTLGAKVPFWTFTGALDAIYVNSVSATVIDLAALAGEEERRVPKIQAGTFDAATGNVDEPGIVFEWGPSTNLLGENIVTPIKLTGACTFDPFWNVSAAGQLSVFEEVFGERMRILGARGSYAAPQDGTEGGRWTLRGDLVFDPLIHLSCDFATSFAPGDFHATAVARGTTLIPSEHWIAGIVPNLTGTVTWLWRREPTEVNRLTFHGHADIPPGYPVLSRVMANKGVGFSYDFATGEYDWQLTDVYTDASPAKAATKSVVVSGGRGAGGLVALLRHAADSVPFSLELPDGTLLIPASADGQRVEFIAGQGFSMYVLDAAPDGTYRAGFEDETPGATGVEFFTPQALPALSVVGAGSDASLARYETLDVPFTASGAAADATLRAYLDDDDAAGGGTLVGTALVGDASVELDVADAPAGAYRLVLQALGSDGMPVEGVAAGRVTVREHVALAVTKGSIADAPARAKDKLSMSGTLAFDGPRPARLFDPATETLRLSLGGASSPLSIRVAPGDPGWKVSRKGVLKWRSARGATPVVALTLDPVKSRFSVKVTKADFAAPPANPVRVDLAFGSDRASDSADWTETSPGRLVR